MWQHAAKKVKTDRIEREREREREHKNIYTYL